MPDERVDTTVLDGKSVVTFGLTTVLAQAGLFKWFTTRKHIVWFRFAREF